MPFLHAMHCLMMFIRSTNRSNRSNRIQIVLAQSYEIEKTSTICLMQGTAASFRPSRWPCGKMRQVFLDLSDLLDLYGSPPNISTFEHLRTFLFDVHAHKLVASKRKKIIIIYIYIRIYIRSFQFYKKAHTFFLSTHIDSHKTKYTCVTNGSKWYAGNLLDNLLENLLGFVDLCIPTFTEAAEPCPRSPNVASELLWAMRHIATYCDMIRHCHAENKNITPPPRIDTNHLHPLRWRCAKVRWFCFSGLAMLSR